MTTPENNLRILAGIQPAELRRKGATLCLARRAVEPGHLLHSALTCSPGGNGRHLKSSHPFIPPAQQLISSSDDYNRRAACWADRRWNAEWMGNTTRLRTFIPDIGTHLLKWPCQERRGPALAASARFRSCLHKWGMTHSAASECGAKEQTVDHVVLRCPTHWPRNGAHGLTVLDDNTIECLFKTCPEI